MTSEALRSGLDNLRQAGIEGSGMPVVNHDDGSDMPVVNHDDGSGMRVVDHDEGSGMPVVEHDEGSGMPVVNHDEGSGMRVVDHDNPRRNPMQPAGLAQTTPPPVRGSRAPVGGSCPAHDRSTQQVSR